jgi:hypothetical protein
VKFTCGTRSCPGGLEGEPGDANGRCEPEVDELRGAALVSPQPVDGIPAEAIAAGVGTEGGVGALEGVVRGGEGVTGGGRHSQWCPSRVWKEVLDCNTPKTRYNESEGTLFFFRYSEFSLLPFD